MVVGDLGVVHQIFRLEGPLPPDGEGQVPVLVHRHRGDALGQRGHHILGDVAGVGTGIGEHLVVLIEGLHHGQGLFRRIGVLPVGVPLEFREVVGGGRRRLPPLALEGADDRLLPRQTPGQGPGFLPVEDTGLSLPVPPGGGEALQPDLEGVKLPGPEGADGLLPVHDEGQGGGLHPPGGELGVILAGEGPGHIEAHQPVGLAPGPGGVEEIVILRGRPQAGKALPDGPVGLGGDPQPLRGTLPPGLLQDPAGHQLPLPARVGGDDQFLHIPPVEQGPHRPELPGALGDDRRLHRFGQHGQSEEVPLLPRLVVLLRGGELHQMAQGPGDDVLRTLQTALAALRTAQHPGQFPAHRGFFRQHQCFGHEIAPFGACAPVIGFSFDFFASFHYTGEEEKRQLIQKKGCHL